MSTATAERLIDTDSHVIEPPDLWTSRVPRRFVDHVPQVRADRETGEDMWFIGDDAMSAAAQFAMVGWTDVYPNYPPRMELVPSSAYDGAARLRMLDEAGIYAQVIYPNLVGGFFAHKFRNMETELALACVHAYNDFLTDFSSADPERLIPLTALPFWDVEASVKEMERCKDAGHRGVLFAHTFEQVGLPNVHDERWHPILDAAQSLGQSVNFHIGFASFANQTAREAINDVRGMSRMDVANSASLSFLSNARAINLLIFYGVCARYPDLKFVAVESGFGFVPYQLQAMDWQWENNGLRAEFPERLKPSEYFRRQMYATMWFEKPALSLLEEWQDNVMWETDYPHPTAQWPTPTSAIAVPARDAVDYSFEGLSATARQKIVSDNAASLYRIG